ARRPRKRGTGARFRAHHQHRHHCDVPELACHAAVNDVGDSVVSVRRHGDEIALLALGTSCNFLRGIATGQNRFRLVAFLLETVGDRLDVLAVALHLFRFAKIELIDVARCPAVGDMDQNDRGIVAGARQLPDVSQDHIVVRRVLDGNEYALIHQLTIPRKNWNSSQMLSPPMITATAYASSLSQTGFTNSPIFSLSEVNITSGKTANDNCILRMTWLRTSSFAVPLSPYMKATITAGKNLSNRAVHPP